MSKKGAFEKIIKNMYNFMSTYLNIEMANFFGKIIN